MEPSRNHSEMEKTTCCVGVGRAIHAEHVPATAPKCLCWLQFRELMKAWQRGNMLQPTSHSFPQLFCEHTWQKFDMDIPPTPKKMPDFQVFSPSNWGWDWPNLWKPMMRRGMASMTCSSWDRVLRLQGFYNPKVWLVLRDGFNEMVNIGVCLSAIFHPFWKIKVILTLKTETIKEAVQSP